MTATDELRRMLDERGVEHFDGFECTFWGDTVLARRDGSCPIYRFSATEVADGVSVHLLRVSPEQAIEATLGRGTCHINLLGMDYQCSGCGEVVGSADPTDELHIDGNAIDMWRFCHNCGREVVDA